MSTAKEFGLSELSGTGSTAAELVSCKIGGCCGADTPPLSADDLKARIGALPLWSLKEDNKVMSRTFTAKNWAAAMSFFNAVSEIAEEEGHHPDLHLTSWRNVAVELSTHAIGGLSMPDLVMAAKIDAIKVDYSPKWLRERPEIAEAVAKAQKTGD